MESLFLFVSMTCCLVVSDAAPWGNYETTPQQQACGDKLADIMSLVCSGRGYNNPFRPEPSSARRSRRQIVEECCRRSCNPALLELYCKAETTEAPTNIQIRKRSDSEAESTDFQQEQEITRRSIKPLAASTEALSSTTEHTESTTKKREENKYKLLSLLEPSEHNRFKQKTKNSKNKSIQNDTTEEEFYKQNTFPPIRHHKNLQHLRQLRGRKTNGKTKREKNASDESKQTFQIGTVKPYFAGRSLVPYRGNYVHQRHAAPPPHS